MRFDDLLVFAGLMAVLGSVTKIILTVLDRRRIAPSRLAVTLEEISERLARLEQAADATALEVERISEGQRFTTKLLAERATADTRVELGQKVSTLTPV